MSEQTREWPSTYVLIFGLNHSAMVEEEGKEEMKEGSSAVTKRSRQESAFVTELLWIAFAVEEVRSLVIEHETSIFFTYFQNAAKTVVLMHMAIKQ